MEFIWRDEQLLCQDDAKELLGSIGFKMINNAQTYVIEHTWVAPSARGKGIAKKMTVYFLEQAEKEGKTILPLCPYTQKFFESESKYKNLLFKQNK